MVWSWELLNGAWVHGVSFQGFLCFVLYLTTSIIKLLLKSDCGETSGCVLLATIAVPRARSRGFHPVWL